MQLDWVSNPVPLALESDTALHGSADTLSERQIRLLEFQFRCILIFTVTTRNST